MNITYFIQLDENDASSCRWLRFNGRSSVGSLARGSLESALQSAQGQAVVIFAAATDVSLASLEVAAKNRRQAAAAVPYMLEEELATDVEELHISLHGKSPDGETLVSIISKERIDFLFKAIEAFSFRSVAVVPVNLSVPFEKDSWTLFVDDEYSVIRVSATESFGVDSDSVSQILPLMVGEQLKQGEESPRIHLYDLRQNPGQDVVKDDAVSALIKKSDTPRGESASLVLLAGHYFDDAVSINLLQGDYQARSDVSERISKWALAASLAGISLLLMLLSTGMDNYHLAKERDLLDESIKALYLDSFPDDKNVENPVIQMRKRLSVLKRTGVSSDTLFLPLVALSSKHLIAAEGSRVVTLRYRNMKLEIDVETSSIETLERLQKKIAAESINVELKSVTSTGGKVRGRLLLSGEKRA